MKNPVMKWMAAGVCLSSSAVFAQGHEHGNGGGGWVCRENDAAQTLRWVKLCDLWEGEFDPRQSHTYDWSLSIDQARAYMLKKVETVNADLAKVIDRHLTKTQARFTAPLKKGAKNILPEDATFTFEPDAGESCPGGTLSREAIAIYLSTGEIVPRAQLVEGEKGIKPLEQFALLLHESLFELHREYLESSMRGYQAHLNHRVRAVQEYTRQEIERRRQTVDDLFYGYPKVTSDLIRKIVAELLSEKTLSEKIMGQLKELYQRKLFELQWEENRNEWFKIRDHLSEYTFSVSVSRKQRKNDELVSEDPAYFISLLKGHGFKVVSPDQNPDYQIKVELQNPSAAKLIYIDFIRKNGEIFHSTSAEIINQFSFPAKKLYQAGIESIQSSLNPSASSEEK